MLEKIIGISLSISIREPKRRLSVKQCTVSISLSISIREPKPDNPNAHFKAVSVYQYPSENQNVQPDALRRGAVSVYQYPSENQNGAGEGAARVIVSVYQYPSENQNLARQAGNNVTVSVYQYPSENQNMKKWIVTLKLGISLSISIREPKRKCRLKVTQ